MFRAWYVPFYDYGVIPESASRQLHHPRRRLRQSLTGCLRVFEPSFLRGVIELYKALRMMTRTAPSAPMKSGDLKTSIGTSQYSEHMGALHLDAP